MAEIFSGDRSRGEVLFCWLGRGNEVLCSGVLYNFIVAGVVVERGAGRGGPPVGLLLFVEDIYKIKQSVVPQVIKAPGFAKLKKNQKLRKNKKGEDVIVTMKPKKKELRFDTFIHRVLKQVGASFETVPL